MEYGKCFAVPGWRRGGGELKDGRRREGDAEDRSLIPVDIFDLCKYARDAMGNDRVIHIVAGEFILGTLLVQSRDLYQGCQPVISVQSTHELVLDS